jgi:ribosomal protein S24E
MEIKIIQDYKNILFNRREIKATIHHNTLPSREEVSKLLAEKCSSHPENIAIKKIAGKFGTKTFDITANVYHSAKDKDKTEIKTQKQRNAEKKAAEEAAKSAKVPKTE